MHVLAGSISLALALALYFFLLKRNDTKEAFLSSQPWVGVREEWVAHLRASIRILSGVREFLDQGYQQFSKSQKAFVLPSLAEPPWLVLPPSSLRELILKSDADLDHSILHEEQLQIYHTQGALGHHTAEVPLQYDIVRRQLSRQLPLVAEALHDEVDRSFRHYWGSASTATREINLSETCTNIVIRTANRVFAGPDVCSNENFIEHMQRYSEAVVRAGIIIRLLPRWLRSVIAPILRASYRRHLNICRSICVPVIRRRVQQAVEQRSSPLSTYEAPTDVLQWLVDAALQRSDRSELDPLLLTQRLLMLNFVSIETTAMGITHAIADLYSSADAEVFVAGLREECQRVLPRDGAWTKSHLDQLVRIDSTIRESMRVSDFAHIQIPRVVANPNGVDLKTTGDQPLHVPPGVKLCVPAHSIHRDPEFYIEPLSYNAFRFVTEPSTDSSGVSESPSKRPSLATTTNSFLVFGHGRHACPGRFFAALIMKLILAYIVQHYDVARLTQPVEKQVQVGTTRPDASLRLTVRRRGA
ncbi:cytochrome P450 [Aspergillus karnatakaensis]|uniref:cytochrome P450 n=1 Tax=Aspergillus karnatakaensis TaxID=1810916 RepID=UPI003CCCF34A